MQGKNWCFTLNNYTDDELNIFLGTVKTWLDKKGDYKVKYAVVGKETGKEGTPHLQGYIMVTSNVRFNTMKKVIPRAHLEKARGTPQQNYEYCTKEGDYLEWGDLPEVPETRGAVKQWEDIRDAILGGCTYGDVFMKWPGMAIKYKNNIEAVIDKITRKKNKEALEEEMKDAELKWWQKIVLNQLQGQNNREVLWVWDEAGGVGKTWMAKYLLATTNALYITTGKQQDHALAWEDQDVIIFDMARSKKDVIPYTSMEYFKNGLMFSGKYQSKQKIGKPCKVIVFANYEPDRTQLSGDRWNVIEIESPQVEGQ